MHFALKQRMFKSPAEFLIYSFFSLYTRLRVSLSAAHSNADVDDLIRLVQQSAVPLVRLPHLEDERAALPGGAAARGTGTAPLGSGGLTAAAGHVAAASRGAVAQSRL